MFCLHFRLQQNGPAAHQLWGLEQVALSPTSTCLSCKMGTIRAAPSERCCEESPR